MDQRIGLAGTGSEPYLYTERLIVSQIINIMSKKELQTLEEAIVFCLHIRVPAMREHLCDRQ